MSLQTDFEKLHYELKSYLERLPGYGQLILVILTMSPKERVEALKIVLEWLKRYPDIQIMGLRIADEKQTVRHINKNEVPFTRRYKLETAYKCKDCQKECLTDSTLYCRGELHSYDVTPSRSEEGPHLVCSQCMPEYNEPEYDPPEPDSEFDKWVDELVDEGYTIEEAVEIINQERGRAII